MNYLKPVFFALIFTSILGSSPAFGQKSIRDSTVSLVYLSVTYSGNSPAGDLSSRFGFTNLIGGEFSYKFNNNFTLTTGFQFLFGTIVKELVGQNVINYVYDSSLDRYFGTAIGENGKIKEVQLMERGYVIPFRVGKIFPLFERPNPNSGIYIELGGQFIQHHIRINVPEKQVPQLTGDYLKGYDRQTTGFGVVEGVGYRYFGNKNYLNFFLGAEISQNFTKSGRSVQFDTGSTLKAPRTDLLFGFKAGWTFLFIKRAPDEFYFY